ncbi:hypothetical protein K435DRAFT_869893 [Dendrothele bispora CBS 962.96]|uniref:DUF6532 domain-containing protein n=1 Tax=Dendrothele bispora (strain CBS 962.96) TaxID=1314807 RepID=A0A4S8L813_DENBC|nr:hypothetical protein K435DRAFT_869893 [Dendrothele bispora CBS 962.96]
MGKSKDPQTTVSTRSSKRKKEESDAAEQQSKKQKASTKPMAKRPRAKRTSKKVEVAPDEPESEEDFVLIKVPRNSASGKSSKAAAKHAESSDSNSSCDESSEFEDDRSNDNDADSFFDLEAPQIMSEDEDNRAHRPIHRRLSSLPGEEYSVPPSTNTEACLTDQPDEDEDDIKEPRTTLKVTKKPGKSSSKSAQKLQGELPQVTNETLPVSHSGNALPRPTGQGLAPVVASMAASNAVPATPQVTPSIRPTAASSLVPTATPVSVSTSTAIPANATPPTTPPTPPYLSSANNALPITLAVSYPLPSWRSHTEIVIAAKNRSFELDSLKLQNQVIRKVLERAFKIGKLYMLVDDLHCPLNDELKNIAFGALVEACHQLRRDAEDDVLGHLQVGDYDRFIKPVVTTTYHHIGLERKDLKLSQMSSVLSAYNLVNDPALGRDRALRYITAYSYHCGTLPSGVYDPTKPFESAALPIYIGAMFFGAHPYAAIIANNKQVFKSSVASKPNKLELPKGMVAISVAAIHSILSDFARQCKENFPSKELAGVWQTSLAILRNIEQVNKNHYHALMHSLYLKSSGSLPLAKHGLTNQQIFDSVDWSAFADDQGSPSNDITDTPVLVTNAAALATASTPLTKPSM